MQPSPAYWDTKRMKTGAAITRALRYMGLLKSSILDRVGRSSLPSRWQSLHYQGHVPQDDEDLDKGLGAESLSGAPVVLQTDGAVDLGRISQAVSLAAMV